MTIQTVDLRPDLSHSLAERARLEIGIGDSLRLPWVEAVGDEIGDGLVLGRSALNKLRVLLDGPRKTVEIAA